MLPCEKQSVHVDRSHFISGHDGGRRHGRDNLRRIEKPSVEAGEVSRGGNVVAISPREANS